MMDTARTRRKTETLKKQWSAAVQCN